MIIGIDAANISSGGGVTHLVELLKVADPVAHGFTRIIIWSGRSTLSEIEERPWLTKEHHSMLDGSLVSRAWWQRFHLSRLANKARCDVLFVPGGSYRGKFQPVVAFSQNLLPFEFGELRRYGLSLKAAKMLVLRRVQSMTFRAAAGVIFLTRYAREAVFRVTGETRAKTAIVPHGVDSRFVNPPRAQRRIAEYSTGAPFRILYVSVVEPYKHQWCVAEAVARVRISGLPVELELVGSAYAPSLGRLRKTLQRLDPNGEFLRYRGLVAHDVLPVMYAQADLFVFASSCEAFGQILIEAMASGLPVACSNRSAMPELLGDAGLYFDPENPVEMAEAIRQLVQSPELRQRSAAACFERARVYSWARCARETFAFLKVVANQRIG